MKKHIKDDMVDITCLNERKCNPANAMTKKNHNHDILQLMWTNKVKLKIKCIFMLLKSLYKHNLFIPTSLDPMHKNINPTHHQKQFF